MHSHSWKFGKNGKIYCTVCLILTEPELIFKALDQYFTACQELQPQALKQWQDLARRKGYM